MGMQIKMFTHAVIIWVLTFDRDAVSYLVTNRIKRDPHLLHYDCLLVRKNGGVGNVRHRPGLFGGRRQCRGEEASHHFIIEHNQDVGFGFMILWLLNS